MQSYKKILFGLILTLLLISPLAKPVINTFNWSIMPLRGHIEYTDKPEFSWHGWFEGTYQGDLDPYLEENVAFRNFLVRVYNQTEFSLFKTVHANEVILGKKNYLYELNYIRAYTGSDFLGHEIIQEKCSKLKVVQDELAKLDIELLVVLAPGKASFFPEYIPDELLSEKGPTNNQVYLQSFEENDIKHIDFNSYFQSMKDTSEYVLVPKCGIHWSTYGSMLALDSIVAYIENTRKIDMVDVSFEGIKLTHKPRSTDYDVGDALNLLWRIPSRSLAYPYGYSLQEESKTKPDIMIIADSYYWSFYKKSYNKSLWGRHHFRYYNQELYEHGDIKSNLSKIDLEELRKFDFIMLLYTEANMTKFANDFIEQAYASLVTDE